MKQNHNRFSSNICILHNDDWIKRQRIAGKVAAQTISLLEDLVKNKTTKSLIELDKIAEEFIISNGCLPTFRGYKGFPASVCMSLDNKESHMLVHGIPNDNKLEDGNLITFDLGATFEGAIGDTAATFTFGSPKSEQHSKLIDDTKIALVKSIQSIKLGKNLGVIGDTIFKHLSPKGYSIVENYGGHSMSYNEPHCFPFISNKSLPTDGIMAQVGMTLCIEPLVVLGNSNKTFIGKDGWTVYTENVSFHEEHSIFLHSDYIEVMTFRENETYLKTNKILYEKS
jgi:methionyl aminopeptidase